MPASGGGGDRRLAVDGDVTRHVVAERGERGEAAGVDDLVGDQQVGAEPGRGHADRLAGRGARERRVAGGALAGGERRALVGLDVRPQRGARVGGGHRRQVGVERAASITSAGVGRSCTSIGRRVCHVASIVVPAGVAQSAAGTCV